MELYGNKTKKVIVTSEFPAATDEVWKRLQLLETLQYIANPYATFRPLGNTEMKWSEGQISRFRLKLFGFISLGTHTINVIQFDKERLSVYTNERNKTVPVWNHRILIEKINENKTLYTDEVEIFAGLITPFVYIWSKAFYKHRQKKWIDLLENKL